MNNYRESVLEVAKETICKSRENDYGSPENSFKKISLFWSNYLGIVVTQEDVAMMMALLKIARIKANPLKFDSFVDLAGYAACGWSVIQELEKDIAEEVDEHK